MKKIFLALFTITMAFFATAQNAVTHEEMMKEWRQMKQKRDISLQAQHSNIPLGETVVTPKSTKSLPDDRVWFPGEWEEVQAIVVTPYYSYLPDSNLGSGYYSADPVVTGYAEYYKYSAFRGWESMNIYGPYKSEMDTSSSFGKVFFYLMDGIQKGNAEAWVRVEKAADTNKVLRTLARFNLRHDNVRFIIGPGNSFWYRDCGPICFYYGDNDSLAMMDFEYYPGRALDDSLPSLIYRQMGLPNYINTIEWEGGNCLVDGAGFLFTSDAVYENNNDTYGQLSWNGRDISTLNYTQKPRLSQTQTRNALRSLLGQRETHVLPAYQYDGGTGHIDLYADMCEENGFVFSVMPAAYSNWVDYRTGARNVDSLCSYTSIFDRPYYMSTIPFPSKDNGSNFSNQLDYNENYTRTYSNHTFVNNLILQPCFSTVVNGQPSAAWDRANIEEIKKAYPGYTIYPVDVRDFDGSGGAIHCVTKQIPANNPIRILHKSVVGSAVDMSGHNIPISAIITNRNGIEFAGCVYRINGGWWDTIPMTANGNKYSCLLPTADIDDHPIIDTTYNMSYTVDTIGHYIDTVPVIYGHYNWYLDSATLDTVYVYVYDTTYSYVDCYILDTTSTICDTVITVHDTVITVDYYISVTNQFNPEHHGEYKSITKPITAHNGGYYSFYFDGQEVELDSSRYDFSTDPRPATDITFLFDANRTTLDTSVAPDSNQLAVNEVSKEDMFGQFYPNPASDRANIRINLGNGGRYDVEVIDNLGRTVHQSVLQTVGTVTFSIRTNSLTPGIYTVRFSNNGTSVARRLVVR